MSIEQKLAAANANLQSGITGAITIRVVATSEEFSVLKDSWNKLLESSNVNNYFLRWEWLWTWWNVYKERHHQLCILLAFRDHDLIGIGPFYTFDHVWKSLYKIRRMMFLGTKQGTVISEYMDIICRQGHEKIVITKMLESIFIERLCDDIYLQQMQMDGKSRHIMSLAAGDLNISYTRKETGKSPYVILPKSYEEFIEGCGPSLRSHIKRSSKRLWKYGDVAFRRTRDSLELEKDFDELVRLHQLRWQERGFPGAFSDPRFLEFQRLMSVEMLCNGHLELWLLSISGRNVAALYNVKYNNRILYYQSGLDCSLDRQLSAGIILHNHCIGQAIKEGVEVYDFLFQGNMDAYKDRWTKESTSVGDVYIAVSEGAKSVQKARTAVKRSYDSVKKVWMLLG